MQTIFESLIISLIAAVVADYFIVFPVPEGSKTANIRHKEMTSSSLPIRSGERVVWLSDDDPLYGTVRWTGKIDGEWAAGVDFVSHP